MEDDRYLFPRPGEDDDLYVLAPLSSTPVVVSGFLVLTVVEQAADD